MASPVRKQAQPNESQVFRAPQMSSCPFRTSCHCWRCLLDSWYLTEPGFPTFPAIWQVVKSYHPLKAPCSLVQHCTGYRTGAGPGQPARGCLASTLRWAGPRHTTPSSPVTTYRCSLCLATIYNTTRLLSATKSNPNCIVLKFWNLWYWERSIMSGGLKDFQNIPQKMRYSYWGERFWTQTCVHLVQCIQSNFLNGSFYHL